MDYLYLYLLIVMYSINSHILNFFIEKNKLSAFRLYAYIKCKYNNHLHSADLAEISKDLQISQKVIYSNLRQLIKLGVCSKYSDRYWRFNSWRKWCPINKNRLVDIKLENLRNLKYLRTLYYILHYRSAHYVAKKNHIRKYKNERVKKPTFGFYDTSASFVQKVTGIPNTVQTLLKHLNRGKDFLQCDIIRKYDILCSSPSLSALKLCRLPQTLIKKRGSDFLLISFRPNRTRFFL